MARHPAAPRRIPARRAERAEPHGAHDRSARGDSETRQWAGMCEPTDADGADAVVHAIGPVGPARTAGSGSAIPRVVPAWRRWVGTLGVVLLLALAALAVAVAVVPVVVGGAPLTVLSPSMIPTYPPGTLVVTRPRPVEQIRIGDVLAYTDRDAVTGSTRTVTHRVVGIGPGPVFRTKGDADADPDPTPVTADAVQGVVWYSVPWVGGWGVALRDGPGLLAGFGGILIVIALMVLLPGRRRTE